jgi:hypothetical protein
LEQKSVSINPFKSDTAKKLARDLDTARTARAKLADRLATAQTAVIERQTSTRALARDGADDRALDAAEAALRAAQDRVATLIAALGDAETQVAALESEQAHLADQKLRAETAAAIEVMAQEIEKAGVAFGVAAAQLTEISRRVAEIILDGHGLAAFAMNAGGEVPAAVEMIARLLRDRARATIDGATPAALPKAETVPAPVQQLPPQIRHVFMMRPAKYTDTDGKLVILRRWLDADLPPEIAIRALRSGCAVEVTDPRRKKLFGQQGTRGPYLPDPSDCDDLDAAGPAALGDAVEPAPPPEEPTPAPDFDRPVVKHSRFQEVDRGPAYTITRPRQTMP